MLDAIGRMGEPVFGRITPDGYADRANQWLSSGAMTTRFNFANALATNRIKGTKIDLGRLLSGADLSNEDAVAQKLIGLMIFGDVSPATRAALQKIARVETPASAPPASPTANVPVSYPINASAGQSAATSTTPVYLTDLLTLLIGSPEFQQR